MCLGLGLQEFTIICLFVIVASVPKQTCQISGVCECDFDTDTSLDIVNCSTKELHSIPSDLATDREYYTLTGNSIYSLEDDAFKHIVNALVLDIGANWLTTIPVNIFTPFRNLRHLTGVKQGYWVETECMENRVYNRIDTVCNATTVDVAEPIPGLRETVPVSVNNDESTTKLTQTILDSKSFPKEHATQELTALRLTQ
ncbi:unnamed protein product [Mytilus edulis]|uniref:Uncharacterized protein n=1 Tax=Mytilus edulis TaxID=6550 RepID=A0A8S3RHE6_MYTED|nr:unnamed protein product [Mytilus edulis]